MHSWIRQEILFPCSLCEEKWNESFPNLSQNTQASFTQIILQAEKWLSYWRSEGMPFLEYYYLIKHNLSLFTCFVHPFGASIWRQICFSYVALVLPPFNQNLISQTIFCFKSSMVGYWNEGRLQRRMFNGVGKLCLLATVLLGYTLRVLVTSYQLPWQRTRSTKAVSKFQFL